MDSTLNGAWIFIRDVSKGAVLVAGKNFKVAVVFNNFGPYHIARLSAAAKYSALLGIEVVQESRDYDWEASATTPFARKTLFQSQECSDFNSRTFYLRLARELSQFEPEVIAIPGWYGLDFSTRWIGHGGGASRWSLCLKAKATISRGAGPKNGSKLYFCGTARPRSWEDRHMGNIFEDWE